MPKIILEEELDYSDDVLVVDDDEDDFILFSYKIKKANIENNLVWINSGNDLINYLQCKGEYKSNGHKNPLLIFLDVNMPELNAEETLNQIQAFRNISELRIILLTNADREFIGTSSLKDIPYAQKPLKLESICDYIESNKLVIH